MTRSHVYVPPVSRDRTPKPRCCAACKTPYNCGNDACRCHEKDAGGSR